VKQCKQLWNQEITFLRFKGLVTKRFLSAPHGSTGFNVQALRVNWIQQLDSAAGQLDSAAGFNSKLCPAPPRVVHHVRLLPLAQQDHQRTRGVAAQSRPICEKQTLKTSFSPHRLKGLKPGVFKLWVTTEFDSCTAPHRGAHERVRIDRVDERQHHHRRHGENKRRAVAVQS
jgi:hypothetical protein